MNETLAELLKVIGTSIVMGLLSWGAYQLGRSHITAKYDKRLQAALDQLEEERRKLYEQADQSVPKITDDPKSDLLDRIYPNPND